MVTQKLEKSNIPMIRANNTSKAKNRSITILLLIRINSEVLKEHSVFKNFMIHFFPFKSQLSSYFRLTKI